MNTSQLIKQLSNDLSPTPKVIPVIATTFLWLAVSLVYVFVALLAMGSLRAGMESQLVWPSRFAVEMLTGFIALFFWAFTAIAEAMPGQYPRWPRRMAWLVTGLWVAHFAVALGYPYLESAMIGKREHCAWESFIYSLPPTFYMVWLQQRRYPLNPVRAAAYAAIAAAIIPALAMQVACMYDPLHILQYHLAPIVYLSFGIGAIVYLLVKLGKVRA